MSNIFFGKVTDTKDPLTLGRVKVSLLAFGDPPVELPWLRMISPYATAAGGHIFFPEVGDEVVVLRGSGDDLAAMIVLGSVFNATNVPTFTNPEGTNLIKEIRTKAGNAILFDDKAGEETVTIQTKDAKIKVVMTNKEETITITGGKKLVVTSTDEVSIKSKKVTIEADGDALTLKGKDVSLDASGAMTQKSADAMTIEGGDLTLKGNTAAVESSGALDLKGSTVNIG